jgi:hypothetical protein
VNQPPSPDDLEFYRQAFWDLSPSRPAGMGLSAIPFEAVDRYAERYEVDDFETFHRLIRAQDRVFLAHHSETGR